MSKYMGLAETFFWTSVIWGILYFILWFEEKRRQKKEEEGEESE